MSETTPQDNAAPTSAPPASGGGNTGESGASTGATQIDMGRGRGGRGSKYIFAMMYLFLYLCSTQFIISYYI